MRVRIYQPSKTAMQSGVAKINQWVLEGQSEHRKSPDPVMGWVSGGDTLAQIKLTFEDQKQAIDYAKEKGWTYSVLKANTRSIKPKNYSENFIKRRD